MAKIVYVEDEAAIRAIIVEELVDAGHEVIEATDGNAGLEAILHHAPDLVISDGFMQELSGYELFKTLRCDHPKFAGTPFLFLSANVDRHCVESGLEMGAHAYLTKPVDLDALLETVANLLKDASGSQADELSVSDTREPFVRC